MFKVNNKDIRTTPMAYFTPFSSVSIVNFEQVNAGWVETYLKLYKASMKGDFMQKSS